MEKNFSCSPNSSTKAVDYLFYTILIEKGIKVYCYALKKEGYNNNTKTSKITQFHTSSNTAHNH